jgi:hypothetical protein
MWYITMRMEKLHANELLHRDFETSNILIWVLGLDASKDKIVAMIKKMNDKCVKCGEHEWMERKPHGKFEDVVELQKHVIKETRKMILIAFLEFVVGDCESSNVLITSKMFWRLPESAIGIER